MNRWLLLGLLLLVLTVLFPPARRVGDWREDRSNEPAPPAVAEELDRMRFGYLPEYRWVGLPSPQTPLSYRVTLSPEYYRDPEAEEEVKRPPLYACTHYHYMIDSWILGLQIAVVAVPFILMGLVMAALSRRAGGPAAAAGAGRWSPEVSVGQPSPSEQTTNSLPERNPAAPFNSHPAEAEQGLQTTVPEAGPAAPAADVALRLPPTPTVPRWVTSLSRVALVALCVFVLTVVASHLAGGRGAFGLGEESDLVPFVLIPSIACLMACGVATLLFLARTLIVAWMWKAPAPAPAVRAPGEGPPPESAEPAPALSEPPNPPAG